MDNVEGFENYMAKKKPGSVSPNQNKNEKICKTCKTLLIFVILSQVVIQVKKAKD